MSAAAPTRRARAVPPTPAMLWLFLLGHGLVWTLVPALTNETLKLDAIEHLLWGREWQWGYHKHPPLSAWAIKLPALLFPGAQWPIWLAAQLCTVLAFFGIWLLARELLPPRRALAAVLVLEAIHFYQMDSIGFNANVALYPIWAFLLLAYWRANQGGGAGAWIAVGLLGGLALLTKYTAGVLLLAMLLHMLAVPALRAQFGRLPIYLGIAVGLAVIAPHVVWLVDHDFPTLDYIVRRGGADPVWSDHLLHPPLFLLGQAAILIVPALLLWSLGRPVWRLRREIVHRPPHDFLLAVWGGPFVIFALLSVTFGFEIDPMWGAQLFLIGPLALIVWVTPDPTDRAWRRFLGLWGGFAALLAVAFTLYSLFDSRLRHDAKRTDFPGPALAEIVTDAWHARVDAPLPAVAGDFWFAGNIAYFSPDWPSVYLDADPTVAPWMDDDRFRRDGGVVIWSMGPRGYYRSWGTIRLSSDPGAADHCVRRWMDEGGWPRRFGDGPPVDPERFPGLEPQPPISLPWPTLPDMPPACFGWAILPPTGAPPVAPTPQALVDPAGAD